MRSETVGSSSSAGLVDEAGAAEQPGAGQDEKGVDEIDERDD